jgi:DNA polymerase-3 subunit gamma/tau
MALYLKYRPLQFADVVGQDHVVTTLEQAIGRNQISHAYLFCGTRGTGKTSVARILAKTILLRGMEDGILKQEMVKAMESGSLVDLVEIDAASNRRIDDIRDLIEKINFSPSVSKAKVYIIDEVHMLTKEAFNALLKTLEEPPEYAYFILATTELHKVPDTIQSRCQRFLFRRVKDDDILRRLQYIADQEHIKIERDALRTIARHALGSFRDGIALLDQLQSLEKISLTDVTERIGKTSLNFIEEIVEAITGKDLPGITSIMKRVEESNVPADLIATDLLSIVRTHMHEAIDRKEDPLPYVEMTDILLAALQGMRMSPMPVLLLETALLSLCMDPSHPKPAGKKSTAGAPKLAVDQRKKEKEEKESTKGMVPPPPEAKAAEEKKAALIEVDPLDITSTLKHWKEIIDRAQPPSVRMSLKDGSVVLVENDTVHITFSSAFHRDRVAETKASRTIEDLLQDIFKKPVRIRCSLERSPLPSHGPSTDLVEAAQEVFGSL